jgi:hypothetical protein
MNYKALSILFGVLVLCSIINLSFQTEDLEYLDLISGDTLRIPSRLGKREDDFPSLKTKFFDQQKIMNWIQSHWKKKKFYQIKSCLKRYSNDFSDY